tara:strand:- start:386 stop:988 length:603 start_codon:yes stop_codon:yes gene_type:complete
MARIPINIGVANAGDGDTLFTAFTAVENNFDDLYSDDTNDVNSVAGTAPIASAEVAGDVTISLNDLGVTSGKLAANSVITDKITDLNVTTAKLANDAVTYDKLGNEFTTAQAVGNVSGTVTLDFSAKQVFTAAMTADTIFTFGSAEIGMTKDLILSGAFVPTFTSAKRVAGTYSETVPNFIQIVVVATNDYWLSISQQQT